MTISKHNKGRSTRSPSALGCFVLTMAFAFVGVPDAQADKPRASITGLKAKTDSATTTLRIRGSKTPTFTVYKLENPSRVVVDVVGANLSDRLIQDGEKAVWNVNSWAVGQVSAHNMKKTRGDVVRVVVGLNREGRYQVKADGNDVLVQVTSSSAPPVSSGGMDDAALKKAMAESARAKKEAERELANARAEAAQIREQARKAKQEAQERIAEAERVMRAAQGQRAEAEKAKKLAAAELATARKIRDEATRAEEDAELRKKEAADAAKAARLAQAEVARARSNKGQVAKELMDKARKAAELAELRRQRSEEAMRLAEARRARAEAETARAESKSKAARLALEAAEKDRRLAESNRDRAREARLLAEKGRKTAEVAASTAATRASELKKLLKDEEARVAAARKLRNDEEQAVHRARLARQEAEAQRQAAKSAQAKLVADLSRLEKARKQVDAKRKAAELALSKARQAAANSKVSASERARLQAEADRLAASQRKAEASVAGLQKAHAEQKSELAKLEKQRASASKGLEELQAKADAATRARLAEEKRLASLSGKRKEIVKELEAARSMRAEAKLKFDEASRAQALAKAEFEKARSDRAAAQAEAERVRANAKENYARALAAQKEAERSHALAKADRAEAVKARANAKENYARALAAQKEAERSYALAKADRAKSKASLAEAERARLDAERAREAARKAELEVQRELELAKRARLTAESSQRVGKESIDRANEDKRAAQAALAEAQKLRLTVKKDRKASAEAIARAKKQEDSAKLALAQAKSQLAEAERVRKAGEEALRRAAERERQAAATLAQKAKTKTETVAKPTTRLREVDVLQRSDVARVVIAMSSPAAPKVLKNRGGEAVLEIPSAAMKNKLERTLDTSSLQGPIQAVSSYKDPNKPNTIKVVVDLEGDSKGVLKKVGNTYYWDFPVKRSETVAKTQHRKARSTSVKPYSVAGYGSASSPITQQTVAQVARRKKKTYRGQKIDLDYKNADVHNLMRLLADVGGVNIVVPDDIKAKVTIRLRRVPWDQALDVILASKGLGYKMEGPGLYRIATQKELDAEFEAKLARAKARAESEAPKPEVFNLNYVDAKKVQPQLESLLSPKGRIEIDQRSNAVIVNDVAANRARIIDLMQRLDTQTPQIQIEARIVEARSTFVREFGIQWGGNMTASQATGNATGLIFPSSVGLAGAADDNQTPSEGIGVAPTNFAVNLPAAIGTGAGGGIGLSLGSVGGNFGLNLRLSALEDEGSVRIISAPKITTSNNIEAEIKSGVSIPISVISANGVQTQFVPADLSLKVKPTVSLRDCAVSMQINVTKNEADFVNTGARGDPTLLTKEAKTTILVNDGDTSVIGGIYTRNSGMAYSKVPFLGDLPVVGWLFKNRSENDDRQEVLVFITPKITNRAFLPCGE